MCRDEAYVFYSDWPILLLVRHERKKLGFGESRKVPMSSFFRELDATQFLVVVVVVVLRLGGLERDGIIE